MAFDSTKPRNTTSGALFAQEIRDNFISHQADLDTKISGTANGSYAVQVTFTQDFTISLATLKHLRADGGVWSNWLHNTLASGNTIKNEMRLTAGGAGEDWALTPVDDGLVKDGTSGQPDWRLSFASNTGIWSIGGSAIWHAGNFDALALAPTTAKLGRVRKKCKLLTSSAAVVLAPDTDGEHYVIQLAHTSTFTFALPTGTDGDLGDHYSVSGYITIENMAGAGLVTLVATGTDKVETNGTQDNTVGNVMTLAYTITRFNPGTERHLVTFSWVS